MTGFSLFGLFQREASIDVDFLPCCFDLTASENHFLYIIEKEAKILGHKHLTSTEICIDFEQALFTDQNDEFYIKVAETNEEAS